MNQVETALENAGVSRPFSMIRISRILDPTIFSFLRVETIFPTTLPIIMAVHSFRRGSRRPPQDYFAHEPEHLH